MAFINDSGVIIDDSISPARRWLKDGLRIEQYANVIRFTGVADGASERVEYALADQAAAIAEFNVLYGYLEDYQGGGGGGSALEVKENGTVIDSNVDEINFISPLEATQTAAGKVDVSIKGNGGILTGAMYEMDSFMTGDRGVRTPLYVASVNKIYTPSLTENRVKIYDANSFELLSTITGITGVYDCGNITYLGEVWVANAGTGLITRIDITTNAINGTITNSTQNKTRYIEYLNPTSGNPRVYIGSQSASASPTGSCVVVVDLTTLAVITTIALNTGSNVRDMTLINNPSSILHNHLVVTTSLGIYIIDAATNTVVSGASPITISGFSNFRSIAYIPDKDQLAVSSFNTDDLLWISPVSLSSFNLDHLTINAWQLCDYLQVNVTKRYLLVGVQNQTLIRSIIRKYDIDTYESISQLLNITAATSVTNSLITLGKIDDDTYLTTNYNTTTQQPIIKIKAS